MDKAVVDEMEVVLVEYRDITSSTMRLDELEDCVTVTEVGLLARWDKNSLWLVKDYYDGLDEHVVTVIPLDCINKVVSLYK